MRLLALFTTLKIVLLWNIFPSISFARDSLLDEIIERDELRVETTGGYKLFSYQILKKLSEDEAKKYTDNSNWGSSNCGGERYFKSSTMDERMMPRIKPRKFGAMGSKISIKKLIAVGLNVPDYYACISNYTTVEKPLTQFMWSIISQNSSAITRQQCYGIGGVNPFKEYLEDNKRSNNNYGKAADNE